ncbi:MAG: hypothetical protein RIS29_222 [Bacteroidota bacterium]
MKILTKRMFYRCIRLFLGIVVGGFLFVSCDTYTLDNEEPDWLGASIYNYLKTDGHFTNYTKLVEELDYTEVLSKTGSKTLFVANDSAFNEFYKNNPWGVKSYDQFTLAQKKLIMNFGMINNAYLVGMLSSYYNGGLKEGAAFRRETAVSVLDSVPYEYGDRLPNTAYWQFYKTKGIHLLKDNTALTMMCFTQKHMDQSQITDQDFEILTGKTRVEDDAHIFQNKIIKRDITCKNGYLNLLGSVLTPPMNMADYIFNSKQSSIFSSLLERFSVPAYDNAYTTLYRISHPEFTDSIFIKRYFAKLGGTGGAYMTTPNKQALTPDMLLPFDPGWNSYTRTSSGNALESDMAAFFVPTNEAMQAYFNSSIGAVLKDRFGSWDNVPFEVLPLFIKHHMRTSLIESVPSKFSTMADEDNSPVPVVKDDIVKTYMGTNGVVYETNKVYPPDDFVSVYGPVLLSGNDVATENKTKIWKWAILQNDFRLYLNSMVSRYSFFVPTDEFFEKYIDPISLAKDVPGALKFWYDTKSSSVQATVYRYNKTTNQLSDSVGFIKSSSFIVNRMLDLLNNHVVVGNVESGRQYYITKGNVALKVEGVGKDMKIQGGGNMSMNEKANVTKAYTQSNGTTYFIDKPIQSPVKSVYKVLSETPEFSSFFQLMLGFPPTSSSVMFVNKQNYYGIDYNVKFFNTFNYTVYVPTNEAIDKAIQSGVIASWDMINAMTDATARANAIANLERFVRYHFQDNSVFVDNQTSNAVYQSATMKKDDVVTHFGTFKNKYYKIGVDCTPGGITLTTEANHKVNILTVNGLYNILTRDYVFNNKPSTYKNIDGTGSGTDYSNSLIYTSSTAVIHQIDKVLDFQ